MFKRVEKRIRKKERDEELGLDGEMKEALGINDLNSDDESSDSDDSNDGSSDEDGDSDAGAEILEGGSDAEEGSEADEDEDVGEMDLDVGELEGLEEDVSDADESEDEGEPPMSVSQALQNPLYIVSLDPEVRECIVCPGKLIKNAVMSEVHIKSNAHTRRFTRVREAAMAVDADTDVRLLVRAALAEAETPKPAEGPASSKRALKKKAKLDAIKAKREKQKAMRAKVKARKEAKVTAADSSESTDEDEADKPSPAKPSPAKPPRSKKRKLQAEDAGAKPPTKKPKPTKAALLKADARSKASKEDVALSKPARKAPVPSSDKLRPKAKTATPKTAKASPTKVFTKVADDAKSKKRRRSEPSS